MNPPKLEICFEGYNTDQTDFYIGQLIEKINGLSSENESAREKIASLEAENKQLRNELLLFVKQVRGFNSAEKDNAEIKNLNGNEKAFRESKSEVNSAIRESLKSLQLELNSVKDFIKNN